MKPLIPLIILIVTALTGAQVHSQTNAIEGKVEYQKGDKIAAMLELPYPSDVVEDAIKDFLSKKGLKNDRSKGFEIFRNAKLNEKDPELSDLHFRVERKSRKERDVTTIYLIIARPSENVAVRTSGDRYKVEEAKNYLEYMQSSIDAFNLEVEIRAQEELVKKAERKKQDLEDDQKELEKRIRNLQEKLDENKGYQKKQTDEIVREKTILEVMKGKRNK